MKKTYTSAFKAQIVLELLKETASINQLAAEHGVAPTVLREWKQAALNGLPDLFERRDSVTELKTAHERELEQLSAEIGRLTTHVNTCQFSEKNRRGSSHVRGSSAAQRASRSAR